MVGGAPYIHGVSGENPLPRRVSAANESQAPRREMWRQLPTITPRISAAQVRTTKRIKYWLFHLFMRCVVEVFLRRYLNLLKNT